MSAETPEQLVEEALAATWVAYRPTSAGGSMSYRATHEVHALATALSDCLEARKDAERLLTPVQFRKDGFRDHRDWIDARIAWHRKHGDAALADEMEREETAVRAALAQPPSEPSPERTP